MSRLSNKVAFVTGGSRGIGAAIALKLAEDGADIAITYTSAPAKADETVKAIEKLGRRAIAIKADNLDAKAVESAVNEAHAKLGRLDILVNSAGVYSMDTVDALDLEEFDRVMSIHVRASFVAAKAAVAHMPVGGRIINIGSNLAEIVPFSGLLAYSTSKAALIGLTKALARDLGPKEITANIVHPGSTDTDMNPANGDHAEGQRARMAIPRFGQAKDIAGLVAFLAGEEGRFINGASLTIDGGANA
ncbi:3-oxoacyl-ACP reductase family protein [Phyllobacterium sp. P30BS-XVII]|uniref:3-oxoacyl-ACP reductase family protein n=1 Tax=Phyllobacterium sp. P30BS-XVII TaxID=2587046 RepID=UPI000DD68F4C|nr:3-oxoacyl-ACP reductase family protein [Phyllobacterium sp. P30BS-XVII]MBA8899940.1 NAD(P)-dependent dehydrogenase (short-subunit alcohol dehydrogenase family) [Phyllobacterium sp. P30BS-XVII]